MPSGEKQRSKLLGRKPIHVCSDLKNSSSRDMGATRCGVKSLASQNLKSTRQSVSILEDTPSLRRASLKATFSALISSCVSSDLKAFVSSIFLTYRSQASLKILTISLRVT